MIKTVIEKSFEYDVKHKFIRLVRITKLVYCNGVCKQMKIGCLSSNWHDTEWQIHIVILNKISPQIELNEI